MEPTVDLTICDQAPLAVVPTRVILDDNWVCLEQLSGALETETPLPDVAWLFAWSNSSSMAGGLA